MNTINTYRLPDKARASRQREIETALAAGKVVRFHYPRPNGHSFHKDINVFAPDDVGDLVSFRRSGGATEYVCWDSPELTIEIVEP